MAEPRGLRQSIGRVARRIERDDAAYAVVDLHCTHRLHRQNGQRDAARARPEIQEVGPALRDERDSEGPLDEPPRRRDEAVSSASSSLASILRCALASASEMGSTAGAVVNTTVICVVL